MAKFLLLLGKKTMVTSAETSLLSCPRILKQGSILLFSPTFSWFSPIFPRISRSFPRFRPSEIKFRRTFSKFRGKKNKFRGKEFEKCPLKSHEHQVVLLQPTGCFAKTTEVLAKTSENCDFQTLWESLNSQQLFLSSKSRVKWKGVIWKVLLKRFCLIVGKWHSSFVCERG